MQSVARLEISKARELLERLKQDSIPGELRSVADDSGLEFSDILVEERFYGKVL
jgi:hypothetical protein